MNILVVGGGGREHTIIKKLKENPVVEKIFALPGNGGIAQDAECVNVRATDLEGIVNFTRGTKIDYAVNIDVPDEAIVSRMSGRRACVGCGATYHIVYNPPKTENVCDVCGQTLILRDDDKPETVQTRLKVYHDQTQPLIDFYSGKGALVTVDGTMGLEDVFKAILKAIGK